MFAPTNTYHDAIKDPSAYRQNIVLAFESGYFSGTDGDIEQSGVEFEDYFCTAEDLTYGECPSATMKASLINLDQNLRSFKWGECSAYIGYLSESSDYTYSADDVNAEYTYNSHTYVASKNGFFIDGNEVSGEECYSLLAVSNNTLYAFGNGYTYKVALSTGTPSVASTNRFMVVKMQTPKLVVWNPTSSGVFDVTVVRDGVSETWKYAPMGVFYVERPKNLSGDVVDIDEALDRMRLFDVDATEFLEYFNAKYSSPTIANWLTELCAWVGVTTTATGTATVASYTPNTATTLRTILGYLADALKGVFHFNRYGVLTLVTVGSVAVEEVELRRIENSTLTIAEYITRPITKITNKNLAGLTYITGNGDNAYYILGNPFIQDNSGRSVSDYGWQSYVPMSCVVLEADPLVDMGDAVGIWMTDADFQAYVDEYNRVFIDENDQILGEEVVPVNIPLMHRTLSWNGVCTATYEALGNRTRLVPPDFLNTDYNANIANNTDNIINKIVAHGIEADWIKTGKLESPNGEYSLDMETGTVNMANANITGGTINIQSLDDTSVIRLYAANGSINVMMPNNNTVLSSGGDRHTQTRQDGYAISGKNYQNNNLTFWVGSYTDAYGGGGATFSDENGVTSLRLDGKRRVFEAQDSNGTVLARLGNVVGTNYAVLYLYFDDGSYSIQSPNQYAMRDANGTLRVFLSYNGLVFYDASGNVTKSYPAT